MDYDSTLIVRSKLRYFLLMKNSLDQPRQSMFKATCFGPWLDLTYVDNEESLVQYMLQKQVHQYDDSYDLPIVYCVNGHNKCFGRREFCLITGFRFGLLIFRKWRSGDIPFRDRVFPDKVGQYVKNIDLLSVIEDEAVLLNLSDEDAVRVCLLLTLEVIFMGKDLVSVIDDTLLRMVEDLEEWNAFPWGEHVWRQLYDSIRNVTSKHRPVDSGMVGNTKSKDVPTYCLSGFVCAFKIWIIETSDRSHLWWIKDEGVIPRAVSWSKHKSFGKSDDFHQLFAKESTTKFALYPTTAEGQSQWYTLSLEFFKWYTPRVRPVVEGGPYDYYWKKVARGKQKISQEVHISQDDSSVERCKDVDMVALEAVVNALEARTFKLETIIQVLTSKRQKVEKYYYGKVYTCKIQQEDKSNIETYEKFYTSKPEQQDKVTTPDGEKDLDLGDEYCSEPNEFINMFQSQFVYLESSGEDGLPQQNVVKAEKQEDLCQPKETNFKNSTHKKLPHERYGIQKRRYEEVIRPPFIEVKPSTVPSIDELRNRKNILDPIMVGMLREVRPWVEVLHRPYQNIDRIYVCYEIDRFLTRDGWRNCKFPWCGEIVVDRYFWDSLIGLDDKRKGWLRDEHIDLWIAYMWHTRPDDMEWSMVSCFFLPLLMNGSIPLFYANKEKYPLGWADVERVFIPINEPEIHWSLAVFHIRTGNVTFYDTQGYPEIETRDFYLRMRNCLETRLPEVMKEACVFEQKGIDPLSYRITFMNDENVPKQGGLFDDCGVWLCILLYRLGNGRLLEVEDPIQTALAYRERLIQFYYKHKLHVP